MYPRLAPEPYGAAVAVPSNGADTHGVDLPVAVPIAHAAVPSFQVAVPRRGRPGTEFAFYSPTGGQHRMVVPAGARAGQLLSVVVLPPGFPPGSAMVIQSEQGMVEITVPDVGPGHVIVVDMGTDLRAWEDERRRSCLPRRCAIGVCVVLLMGMVAVLLALSVAPARRPTLPYASPQSYIHPAADSELGFVPPQTHDVAGSAQLSSLGDVSAQGEVNATQYPGYDEGFVRGMDSSGAEVYRYEQGDQVYIIPADRYYDWRATHYHGSLTNEILTLLLVSSLYRTMMYPRAVYYSHTRPVFFGSASRPFYSSASYRSHFAYPSSAGGRTAYTPVSASRPVGSGRTGAGAVPVATARPMGQGTSQQGFRTPVAQARPAGMGTPYAQGRPAGGTSGYPTHSYSRPSSGYSYHSSSGGRGRG